MNIYGIKLGLLRKIKVSNRGERFLTLLAQTLGMCALFQFCTQLLSATIKTVTDSNKQTHKCNNDSKSKYAQTQGNN